VLKRFTTREALLLFALGALVVGGGLRLAGLAPGWVAAGFVAWLVLGYEPLLHRLHDRALEFYLATGRFDRALALAAKLRDAAFKPRTRDLAEFDVGLVHLARGAPADAARSFGRIERHRHKEHTRRLVALYQAVATMRATPGADRTEAARNALRAAREAVELFGEDAPLCALEGEALLSLGESEAGYVRLRRSVELDGDPVDPSPGERHCLLGRAALATGRTGEAREAFAIAARQVDGAPFVQAAKEELGRVT